MRQLTQKLKKGLWICMAAGVLCASAAANNADFLPISRVNLIEFSALSASWKQSLPWCRKRPPRQMVAHWRLDQNALDSHSIHDGVVYGDAVWVPASQAKVGRGAILMNGQDYIEVDPIPFPVLDGSLTLVAWFRTNYNQNTQTIFSKGESSWQMGLEAGTAYPFLSCPGLSGQNYLFAPVSLADGQWHQLAGVFDQDQGKLYLYLDQMLIAESSANGQIAQNSLPLWLGGNPETLDSWWRGTLDNLRIYNYALTAAQIYQQKTLYVDGQTGNNRNDGSGPSEAFKTIQHAIDNAADGDTVLVWPGIYTESLFFEGKAITVRSAADAAILRADPVDGIAVTFMAGEQGDTILENFVILNSVAALYIHQTRPTLRHLTVVNNQYGAWCFGNARPTIQHSIFWNNSVADIDHHPGYVPEVSFSCIQRTFTGIGNIDVDPLFVNPVDADPNKLDFHLQSQYGRYVPDKTRERRPKPENWVFDSQTSPCIDAGDGLENPMQETMPNGGRINMGAYGNTPFAGKSPWPLPADLNYNGDVWLEDLLIFTENWLSPH